MGDAVLKKLQDSAFEYACIKKNVGLSNEWIAVLKCQNFC